MRITDLQENEMFTELTPEEAQEINGGHWSWGIAGAFVGGLVGFAVGGPGGAIGGIGAGWTVGNSFPQPVGQIRNP